MRTYLPRRTDDEAINRNLDGIAGVLADLQGMPVAQLLEGFPAAVVEDTKTLDSETIVYYRGTLAATLTLPGAKSLGLGTARFVFISNESGNTVTMATGSGETIVGTAAVATATRALFISDGSMKWTRWI